MSWCKCFVDPNNSFPLLLGPLVLAEPSCFGDCYNRCYTDRNDSLGHKEFLVAQGEISFSHAGLEVDRAHTLVLFVLVPSLLLAYPGSPQSESSIQC